ncbi:MAG TPA: biliverdin-producing heme oxygenase [Rhizomicrobium sp.]|jgi:heme oxygenase|nr:biliverdin-producing heme oxygenase [Rhizomicrobium sp.]
MIINKDGCSSVRGKLREATASLHAEFDSMAETLLARGAEGYAEFLAAQGAVIIPLEKRLEISGIERLVPDWNQRARRYDLKADLREIAQPCDFVDVPLFRTPAELLGAAYVLEGSRLDASLLLRMMHAGTATRFLRHGQGKGLWPRFLSLLETNSEVHQNFDQARASATEVYRLYLGAMKAVGPASLPAEWNAAIAQVIAGRETIATDRS